MKRKILFGLLIIILFLSGCNKKEKVENNTPQNNNSVEETVTNGKSVVLFFSATGTTKSIAQRISEKSRSDIIEIVPEVEYTSADLNYNSDCRANREQNDKNARPGIKNTIDISNYDIVYLGYPIWW